MNGAAKRPEYLTTDYALRVLILAGGFIFIGFILAFQLPGDFALQQFRLDEPAPGSLFSPVTFSFEDKEETARARKLAAERVELFYDLDVRQLARMEEVTKRVFKTLSLAPIPDTPLFSDPEVLFSDVSVKALRGQQDLSAVQEKFLSALKHVWSKGIIAYGVRDTLLERGVERIALRVQGDPAQKKTVAVHAINAPEDAERVLMHGLDQEGLRDRRLVEALVELGVQLIAPNVTPNPEETELQRKLAAEAVKPSMVHLKKNQVVVQRGRLITPQDMLRIQAVEKQYVKQEVLSQVLGTAVLVLACFFVALGYLLYFERAVFFTIRLLALLLVTLALGVLLGRAVYALVPSPWLYFFLPGSLASLLLTLLVRPRLGMLGAVLMAMFYFIMMDFRADVTLMTLAGSAAASYAAIGMRRRSQFLKVGMVIGLANFMILLGYSILSDRPSFEALRLASFGFLNGFVVVIPSVLFLVTLFEHFFEVTTDISLLELCDLNHPLLKRMMLEAPGTYHHSQVVARLGEEAAETISANGLLTRVGCYFHDIGKLEKSNYFIENQQNKETSKHQQLAPSMSALIITAHVKDGIALGKKYKLKDVILDFIPQHQGTTPVYYFYRKALEQKQPGEEISIDNFRYPGPRPQRKETAITLLADSVEAASRTLKEYSYETVKALVERIIGEKCADRQLDECDLTFAELRKISESFTRSLMGIYHSRIAYPERNESERPSGGGLFGSTDHTHVPSRPVEEKY